MSKSLRGRRGRAIREKTLISAPQRAAREPILNVPWPLLLVAAAIVGSYGLQRVAVRGWSVEHAFGFAPADLQAGRPWGLVTALFVHGSWAHAGMNAVGALAFGAPVIRLFGSRARGAAGFFCLYLLSGVLGSLGFALVRWGSPDVLVGASGAVSGLMGAASRLADPRAAAARGEVLGPLVSRTVIAMAAAWIVLNLLIGFTGMDLGQGGQPVAWQAHLFGYAAGLLLLAPLARLAGVDLKREAWPGPWR